MIGDHFNSYQKLKINFASKNSFWHSYANFEVYGFDQDTSNCTSYSPSRMRHFW